MKNGESTANELLPEDVQLTGGLLLSDAKRIIDAARANAVRSVDFNRVMMYWNLGWRIFEEEQCGKDRADYGTYLTRNLARDLEPEYGSGFGVRQLEFCRKFYRVYPIANTLYSQSNWSQYKLHLPNESQRLAEMRKIEAEYKSAHEESDATRQKAARKGGGE